ncbi:PIN domain-containing protein [Candidatus Bathyarchaeota archaeon]|nr:PIN domain-containing protein [Candidatus Bathyarchaeota archaeon]
MVERIYLDTNVHCRPFDDQNDMRIQAESNAFIEIADAALRDIIVIASSDYVKFRFEKIMDQLKRKDARSFERTLASVNIASNRRVIALAKRFSTECDLNPLDALHVSSACIGKVDWFLTCDDEILQNYRCIEELAAEKGYKLKVRNPVNYLKKKRR